MRRGEHLREFAGGRGRNQVRIVASAAMRGGGITLTRRAIYRVNRVPASPGLRVRQAAPPGEALKRAPQGERRGPTARGWGLQKPSRLVLPPGTRGSTEGAVA